MTLCSLRFSVVRSRLDLTVGVTPMPGDIRCEEIDRQQKLIQPHFSEV
jgi:hypothetical protein